MLEGLGLAKGHAEHLFEAELYRLKGELTLQQSVPDAGLPSPEHLRDAEVSFQKAVEIARAQQSRSLELRAATSLARLWQSKGKHREARDLLAPIYGWFTEGFDTKDLRAAKALLEELG